MTLEDIDQPHQARILKLTVSANAHRTHPVQNEFAWLPETIFLDRWRNYRRTWTSGIEEYTRKDAHRKILLGKLTDGDIPG